jgi:hypothetical protein
VVIVIASFFFDDRVGLSVGIGHVVVITDSIIPTWKSTPVPL